MFDRISTRGLAILFALVPSTGFAQQVDGAGGTRVEVQIKGAENKAAFKGADPIAISFTMKNPSAEKIQVLSWRTPFAKGGLTEDIFAVAGGPSGAGRIQYIGPIVKRRPPGPEDYITLGPGESLTASVNLATYYAIYQQGDYAVDYRGTSPSPAPIAAGTTPLGQLKKMTAASNAFTFSVTEARAPALKAVIALEVAPGSLSFDQCDNGQQEDLKKAVPEALNIATAARDVLISTPADKRPAAQRYKMWFGAYSDGRYATITNHYEQIQASFRTKSVQIACKGDRCDPSTFAYVFPNQPYIIYVCGQFWAAGLSGTDSRSGTLVHEMSHFNIVASTDDHAYGQSAASQLATQNPDDAVDNADSHEYFAENQPNNPM